MIVHWHNRQARRNLPLAGGAEGRVAQGDEGVFAHDREEAGSGSGVFGQAAGEIGLGGGEIGFGVIQHQTGLDTMAIAGLGHIEKPFRLYGDGLEAD